MEEWERLRRSKKAPWSPAVPENLENADGARGQVVEFSGMLLFATGSPLPYLTVAHPFLSGPCLPVGSNPMNMLKVA